MLQGAGCALMERTRKFEEIVLSMKSIMTVPLTAKIRTGVHEHKNTAHLLIPNLRKWGVSLTSVSATWSCLFIHEINSVLLRFEVKSGPHKSSKKSKVLHPTRKTIRNLMSRL